MTITAKAIAHSVYEDAPPIVTLQLRYPRFIHAEFMTHRVFSRNASSSRAIPIEKMIQDVIDDPAMPVAWGSNKPGMQAGEECTDLLEIGSYGSELLDRETAWLLARDRAVEIAKAFADSGYHKQIANRLLEAFGHISVIVTATEWDNFFALRCHPDADPTMRTLAEAMREAISKSVPRRRDWHLPYVTVEDWEFLPQEMSHGECFKFLAMVSAARCARVSYLNHDGSQPDIGKDMALANRLRESRHMSPFEHQAAYCGRHTSLGGKQMWPNTNAKLRGNFAAGWDQHRKVLES